MADDATLSGSGKPDMVGRVLEGRYRVERLLGRGGMGTAYLATDQRLSRPVVVKVPHPALLADPEFVVRFQREVRSLTTLEHAHVAKVIDAGAVDGVPFAVLQYLPGGSLGDRVRERGGRLRPDEVMEWLPDVADALDFVHRQGMVHRDVKPGNILFDAEGAAYLADFGIAKAIDAKDTGLTHTGQTTPGSAEYMPPEGVKARHPTPAYDQYSLATVVYHALAGRLPFEYETPADSFVVKNTTPPRPLEWEALGIPETTARAVMRALERDLAKRFASCRDFAAAFAAGLAGSEESVTLGFGHASSPVRRPAGMQGGGSVDPFATRALPRPPVSARRRTSRWLWIGGGGLLLAVMGLVAMSLFSEKDPPPGIPYAADLAEATARAINQDWEAAKDAWARAKRAGATDADAPSGLLAGIARYDADPVLEVSEPADGATVKESPLHVRGELKSGRSTDVVTVNGTEVRNGPGTFDASVPLASSGTITVRVAVEDRGAARGTPIVRKVNYVGFAADIAEATARAMAGEWEAAGTAWKHAKQRGAKDEDAPKGLLEGLARYDADPVLEVSEPADGATVKESPLHVRGELKTGRATDSVTVNGTEARKGPGTFDASVALASSGTITVTIAVADRGTGRGTPIVRRLTYARDEWPAPVSPFLADWARPEGKDADATTGYPRRIRRTKDAMVMVLIPAGTFQMGAVPGDTLAQGDENPRHAVTLTRAYYMDESEVTVGMWKRYASEKGRSMPTLRSEATDAHPMHDVSWDDVQGYVAWAGVALPTEAQWERAAKGGHDDYVYPWGTSDDVKKRHGWQGDDGFDGLAPVESYAANDYGLYDLSGNVWEWCSDWYDSGYYARSPARDPSGPSASVSSRVLRGGDWNDDAGFVRSSYRGDVSPAGRAGFIGFRCARSLP